jgi:hypothetical protein
MKRPTHHNDRSISTHDTSISTETRSPAGWGCPARPSEGCVESLTPARELFVIAFSGIDIRLRSRVASRGTSCGVRGSALAHASGGPMGTQKIRAIGDARTMAGSPSCAETARSWPLIRQPRLPLALGMFAVCALALGCSGRSEPSSSKATDPSQPIEACERYAAAVKTCLHRDVGFMSQAALRPKTEAERERISALCSDNLERIQQTCR